MADNKSGALAHWRATSSGCELINRIYAICRVLGAGQMTRLSVAPDTGCTANELQVSLQVYFLALFERRAWGRQFGAESGSEKEDEVCAGEGEEINTSLTGT